MAKETDFMKMDTWSSTDPINPEDLSSNFNMLDEELMERGINVKWFELRETAGLMIWLRFRLLWPCATSGIDCLFLLETIGSGKLLRITAAGFLELPPMWTAVKWARESSGIQLISPLICFLVYEFEARGIKPCSRTFPLREFPNITLEI